MQDQSYRSRQAETEPETARPRRNPLPIADWLTLVRTSRHIQGETRSMLEMLGNTRMKQDRKFSVPERELAEIYGVSRRTIRGRIAEAHAAGLLVTVESGRPGWTAVYQGTRPDLGAPRPPRKRSAYAGRAAHAEPAEGTWAGRAAQDAPETGPELGPDSPPKESAGLGRYVVPPTSNHGEAVADERQSGRAVVQTSSTTTNASVRGVREEAATKDIAAAPERSDAAELREDVLLSSANSPADDPSTAERQLRRGETPKGLLLDEIQRCALDDNLPSLDLIEMLNDVEPGLGDYAEHEWTFPAAAADRYEAGRQLKMLKNTYRQPVGA